MTQPQAPRRAQVRFATVRLAGDDALPLDFSATLRAALVPGASTTRYGKTWRVGPLVDIEDRPGLVSSRIGYEDTAQSVQWDPEAKDWTTVETPQGTVFPFALDVDTGLLAYQAPASASVLSALQALLNEQGQGRWRVDRVMVEETWSSWRSSVARVRRLAFVLRRPNPNYVGRPRVESLLEDANAGLVRLVLEAPADSLEGLDLEAEYVREAIDHAVERGYGSLKADGEQDVGGQAVERRYDSAVQGAELLRQIDSEADVLPPSLLSQALATVGSDPLLEVGDDDERDA